MTCSNGIAMQLMCTYDLDPQGLSKPKGRLPIYCNPEQQHHKLPSNVHFSIYQLQLLLQEHTHALTVEIPPHIHWSPTCHGGCPCPPFSSEVKAVGHHGPDTWTPHSHRPGPPGSQAAAQTLVFLDVGQTQSIDAKYTCDSMISLLICSKYLEKTKKCVCVGFTKHWELSLLALPLSNHVGRHTHIYSCVSLLGVWDGQLPSTNLTKQQKWLLGSGSQLSSAEPPGKCEER